MAKPASYKKKSSYIFLFITLIIFLNIFIDQSINTIIIESIQPLDVNFGGWLTISFMALSMPGSLLLSGWSDFHCRRKTLILSLSCAFLSFFIIALCRIFDSKALCISSLCVKAILGNVTPICLATLADIISKNRFRNVLALAIVAYSIGIWMPIYFKNSLIVESSFLFIFSTIIVISIALTILYIREEKFDNVKFYKNPANFISFIKFFKKDTKLIAVFLASPIIGPAILCFLFGEISYYQFLLRGELMPKADFYVSQALVLAIGYYIGTTILLFLGFFNIKDITCIRIGLFISLTASAIIIFEHYSSIIGNYISILIAFFSIGFSFVTPSLFAAISKISKGEEQGKIFGSMDSTDTFATLSSALIIKQTSFYPSYIILLFTFLIFSLSCVFFFKFLRKYKQTKMIS